jgi:hypothetical protein
MCLLSTMLGLPVPRSCSCFHLPSCWYLSRTPAFNHHPAVNASSSSVSLQLPASASPPSPSGTVLHPIETLWWSLMILCLTILWIALKQLGYSTLVVNTLIQKKSENKKRIRAVVQRHTLLKCNYQITATNSPRKKKCHPLKSAFCLWQMCIISEVILLTVWSYINADNEKYQFNCRYCSMNYCYQRYFAM